MEEVQEYFIKNSPSTCKIGGVMKPCKRYSKPEKNCIMDMISLYSYDPKIRDSIENETTYSFDITLDELYNLIPKKRKAKDRYNKLAIVNFCVVKCWISYSFPYFYMHKGL